MNLPALTSEKAGVLGTYSGMFLAETLKLLSKQLHTHRQTTIKKTYSEIVDSAINLNSYYSSAEHGPHYMVQV